VILADAFKNHQKNKQVVHIAGAGHNIRREQFEQFVQTITGFLAEVHS
jgi:hypothetical protein